MAYEFKIQTLVESGTDLEGSHIEILQKLFDEGWEYVDKLTQPVSAAGGSYGHSKESLVAVILKRLKPDLV
jgi:hypothetical protein